MTDTKYNGWTNRETWLVNLWFGDTLAEMQEEGEEITAELIQSIVDDAVSEVSVTGFVADLINTSGINFHELASHYEQEDEE